MAKGDWKAFRAIIESISGLLGDKLTRFWTIFADKMEALQPWFKRWGTREGMKEKFDQLKQLTGTLLKHVQDHLQDMDHWASTEVIGQRIQVQYLYDMLKGKGGDEWQPIKDAAKKALDYSWEMLQKSLN